MDEIIESYSRESGVRELERTIRKLCSKAAREFVETTKLPDFTTENLNKYLGPKRFAYDPINKENQVGCKWHLIDKISCRYYH